MAELKALYEELGLKDVRSYIQSGNLIFSNRETNVKGIEQMLEKAIKKRFLFDVPVIIRTANEWLNIIEKNPFLNENHIIDQLLVSFLTEEPLPEQIANLQLRQTANDRLIVTGNNIFLWVNGPFHKTPLSNQFIEKSLKQKTSTRNWKTVLKIGELL